LGTLVDSQFFDWPSNGHHFFQDALPDLWPQRFLYDQISLDAQLLAEISFPAYELVDCRCLLELQEDIQIAGSADYF
jgi:hypothetical protein